MRRLLLLLLVGLSFCSHPLGADLQAQEIPHYAATLEGQPIRRVPRVLENNSIRRAINSTVRVYKEEGRSSWYGSGTVIGQSGGRWVILTNAHVAGDKSKNAKVEFFKNGMSIGWFSCKIETTLMKNSIDIAIMTTPAEGKLAEIDYTPIASDTLLSENSQLITIGCDAGHWPNLQLGHAVRSNRELLYYLPTSHPGDSGSAVFTADGSRIVALTAWQTRADGVLMGLAMPVSAVRAALLSGDTGQELPSFCISTRHPSSSIESVPQQDLLDLFRDRPEPEPQLPAGPDRPDRPDGPDGYSPKLPDDQLIPQNPDKLVGPLRSLFEQLHEFLTGRFESADRNLRDRLRELEERQNERLQELKRERDEQILGLYDELLFAHDAGQEATDEVGRLTRGFIAEWRLGRAEYLAELEKLRKEQQQREAEQYGLLDSARRKIDLLFWWVKLGAAGLVGLAVAGLFFGQGWALVLLLWVLKAFGRLANGVGMAFVRAWHTPKQQFKPEDIDTREERIAELQKALAEVKAELAGKAKDAPE